MKVPMKVHCLTVSTALVAAVLLGACASHKPSSADNAAASRIQVYNSTQFTPLQYTVIDHIWVDSWRSNISIPTFTTPDAGVQALKEKAAGVGATALLNVVCLDATVYANGRLLCYGDAVRLH